MTESLRGIWTLFRVTGGQLRLLSVNVTCLQFCSLIAIRQLASQFSTTVRWPARCADACRGHFDRLRIAVLLVKVHSVVRSLVGMSAVYRRYSVRPRTLPWGTPASMTWSSEVFALHLTANFFFWKDKTQAACVYLVKGVFLFYT